MSVLQTLNLETAPVRRILHYGMIVASHVIVLILLLGGQWQPLLIALGMAYLVSQLGISFMYHRVLSHNAVKVPRAVEVALTLLGGLSLQGSTLGWVATHNAHHKNQGTPKDPHSPAQSHWLAIQLLGYTFREVNGRHAARLMRDDWHLWFHRNYWKLYGPLLFGSLFLLPTHWAWALFWAPPALVWQLQSLANTWGHNWGKNKADEAHDSLWMFPFILGDCWHRRHHDRPGAVRFHRIDPIGWMGEKLFGK